MLKLIIYEMPEFERVKAIIRFLVSCVLNKVLLTSFA